MVFRRSWLVLFLLPLSVSCTRGIHPPPEAPATPLPLEHTVYYHRTGGLAPQELGLILLPTGAFSFQQQIGGTRTTGDGRLDFDVTRDLARRLRQWDRLRPAYPAAEGAADHYIYTISYGEHTVMATDASPEVPERVAAVRDLLERLASTAAAHPATQPAE